MVSTHRPGSVVDIRRVGSVSARSQTSMVARTMSPDSRFCRIGPDTRFCREERIRLAWGTSPMLRSGAETLAMPKPVPVPVRQKLWERARSGETTASLARAFDVSPRTVRQLLKRFRDRGPDALRPDYR